MIKMNNIGSVEPGVLFKTTSGKRFIKTNETRDNAGQIYCLCYSLESGAIVEFFAYQSVCEIPYVSEIEPHTQFVERLTDIRRLIALHKPPRDEHTIAHQHAIDFLCCILSDILINFQLKHKD